LVGVDQREGKFLAGFDYRFVTFDTVDECEVGSQITSPCRFALRFSVGSYGTNTDSVIRDFIVGRYRSAYYVVCPRRSRSAKNGLSVFCLYVNFEVPSIYIFVINGYGGIGIVFGGFAIPAKFEIDRVISTFFQDFAFFGSDDRFDRCKSLCWNNSHFADEYIVVCRGIFEFETDEGYISVHTDFRGFLGEGCPLSFFGSGNVARVQCRFRPYERPKEFHVRIFAAI